MNWQLGSLGRKVFHIWGATLMVLTISIGHQSPSNPVDCTILRPFEVIWVLDRGRFCSEHLSQARNPLFRPDLGRFR